MLDIIFAFLIFALITIFFIFIYNYLDQQIQQNYQSLYSAENPNPTSNCLIGCRDGICTNPVAVGIKHNNNECRFDFQCRSCIRPEDDTLFSEIYEDIKKNYRRYRNRQETDRLNDRIFKENLDIRKINQAILSGSIPSN